MCTHMYIQMVKTISSNKTGDVHITTYVCATTVAAEKE